MKSHVRKGTKAKARRVESAKTRAECDCEVKKMRPADKRATGGDSEKGY